MLAIARALIVRPQLLILDEASAGLSPKMVETVFARLKDIRATGVTILLVEQNVRAALAISDRAYVLAEGENRHEGRADELWSDPAVAALYLGGGARPQVPAQ
jgi:branched-chain amino acid transport system ATP-binding protein